MIDLPGLHYEQALWDQGKHFVAGIDEAGRGAWAGPIVAGAVMLPNDPDLAKKLKGVRDSKKMSAHQRENWAKIIKSVCLTWSVGICSAAEIDQIGILPSNRLAMVRGIDGLIPPPEYYLFDFIHWKDCPYPGEKLVRGEMRSLSIAAASVLAKTARDELMRTLDLEYPGYGFARHKGYGTAFHYGAIQQLGLCEIHRKSFTITTWGQAKISA
jgi:ribonuclease HII